MIGRMPPMRHRLSIVTRAPIHGAQPIELQSQPREPPITNLLDTRANVLLSVFGPATDWADFTAVMLCPLPDLLDAYRGGRYLVAQGRHASTLLEGMGCAIRRMHQG